MLTVSCVRGCGERTTGATYLCVGQSAHGKQIEEFIIDPPKPLLYDWQRGYALIEDARGVNHVVIFVGETHYGSLWDFIEEARRYGISRKVPGNFPFGKLTPGHSHLIFAHRRVFPQFDFSVPTEDCKLHHHFDNEFCTYHHQNLACNLSKKVEQIDDLRFKVIMPSFEYTAHYPELPESTTNYKPGLFLALPLSHVEFPRVKNPKSDGNARQAGFETFEVDW